MKVKYLAISDGMIVLFSVKKRFQNNYHRVAFLSKFYNKGEYDIVQRSTAASQKSVAARLKSLDK